MSEVGILRPAFIHSFIHSFIHLFIYLFFKDFIYSWRDTHRERQRHRQREKQAPCRKLDVGLGPRTPGSQPVLKADAQLVNHPGIPESDFYFIILFYYFILFYFILFYFILFILFYFVLFFLLFFWKWHCNTALSYITWKNVSYGNSTI